MEEGGGGDLGSPAGMWGGPPWRSSGSDLEQAMVWGTPRSPSLLSEVGGHAQESMCLLGTARKCLKRVVFSESS